MAILEVDDIHTYYGDAYVLQGLSLKLEQGQILGLLGRNGVGKSTLVNSIVGFAPPRRGNIIFKGVNVTNIPSFKTVRTGMGLVPQGRRVFPTLSVEENLMLAEQNAALALKLVDYVHVMSKGQVVYSARPEELAANEQIKSSYLGI